MGKKKQNEDLMDFLAEDEEDGLEAANQVSFELDPYTGELSNESEPGLEKQYVKSLSDKNKDVEVLFDEEESVVSPSIEEESPEEETTALVVDPKKEEIDRKRKARTQERIRQLAKEKREALLKAAEMEETLNRTNAIYAKIQIDNLEKALENVKGKLQVAVENQDAEALTKAQAEYLDTYQQLSEFKKVLPDAEKASELAKHKVQNFDKDFPNEAYTESEEEVEYPEAAKTWMAGKEFIWDLNEYRKLPSELRRKVYPIRAEVQRVLDILVNKEGYSPDDDTLYDELDLRVSTKYPEYEDIASKGLIALNSQNKSPSGETSVKKPRNVEDKTRSTPVKGSSFVGSSEASAPKTTQVKLSKEDVRYWENYLQPRGITLPEYAKQIKAFENEQN